MALVKQSLAIPNDNQIVDMTGQLTKAWSWFFLKVFERLYPLGSEQFFDIVNNQAGAADITGMIFDKRGVSQATVDYLIQRVTTGGSAVELIETGTFRAVYRPTSEDWELVPDVDPDEPDNSGVAFSITSEGQVQYTSSNVGGTAYISKLYWRARTLAGKHHSYSVAGAR